jgi:prepilin-type N-terminal cleavage/methylation domain-containing protein
MRRKAEQPDASRGFTLLEVLVAMVVMAGSLLTVTSALSLSLQAGNQGDRMRQAAQIAHEELVQACHALPDKRTADSGTQGQFRWSRAYYLKDHNLVMAEITVSWSDRNTPQQYRLSEVFIPRDN